MIILFFLNFDFNLMYFSVNLYENLQWKKITFYYLQILIVI